MLTLTDLGLQKFQTAALYYQKALALRWLGDTTESMKYLQRALELNPDIKEAHMLLNLLNEQIQ